MTLLARALVLQPRRMALQGGMPGLISRSFRQIRNGHATNWRNGRAGRASAAAFSGNGLAQSHMVPGRSGDRLAFSGNTSGRQAGPRREKAGTLSLLAEIASVLARTLALRGRKAGQIDPGRMRTTEGHSANGAWTRAILGLYSVSPAPSVVQSAPPARRSYFATPAVAVSSAKAADFRAKRLANSSNCASRASPIPACFAHRYTIREAR